MTPDVERALRMFLFELATLERDPTVARRTGFQAEILLQEFANTAGELLDLDWETATARPPGGPHAAL